MTLTCNLILANTIPLFNQYFSDFGNFCCAFLVKIDKKVIFSSILRFFHTLFYRLNNSPIEKHYDFLSFLNTFLPIIFIINTNLFDFDGFFYTFLVVFD